VDRCTHTLDGMGVRFAGVDAARGIAILGMLWAHTAPDGTQDGLADGRSSVLFATLAGCSLGLLTGGSTPRTGSARRKALLSIVGRALVLISLGIGLALLGTPVNVILDTYGVLFLVLLPIVFAPMPVIAVVAAAAAIGGPFLVQWALRTFPPVAGPQQLPEWLLHRPEQWLLTGAYPGVVWAAYLCVGLIAARAGLQRRRTLVAMIGAGAATSALGYGGAAVLSLDASAHANTTAEALGSGGLAIAIIGALELLCSSAVVGAVAQRVLSPLIAAGRMPLTIYTGQLLVLAVWLLGPAGATRDIASWPLLAGLAIASTVFAMLWQRYVGRGPLENLMTQLTTVGSAPERAGTLR
jgi:uncharacterized membrane protein YeiB